MTELTVSRPKISYEECNRLVLAYRDDCDQEAAAALLDAFEGYIMKFYNVIRKGRVAVHDRNIREFIKLYMKNEFCRRHIHQFSRMPQVNQEIYSVSDSIKSLCQPYSDEELLHEIYVAFLTMAKRYLSPDGKPRFHHYILQAFHYQLRRQLQILVSDPLVFKMAKNVQYYDNNDETYAYAEQEDLFNQIEDKTPTFTIQDSFDTINDNWVLGLTTSEEYRELSIMERKILKMYYLDNLDDQGVADQIGTCRATVNRRRKRIKEKLRVSLAKTNQIIE